MYSHRCFRKVNKNIALIFILGKGLCYGRFSYTPCTSDQQSRCTMLISFPLQHLLIQFSFKDSFRHFSAIYKRLNMFK